ncbi:MAG: hypothetical protein P8107_05205 [Spirochaetia bacterium]
MTRHIRFSILLILPLFFLVSGCGLMTSVSALLPPVENGTTQTETTYKFRITDQAWADDGVDYVYFGIEVYYKIFTDLQSGSILSLTYSNQLSGNGFKRLYREGDVVDNYITPVLYFEDSPPYSYRYFKTSGYSYIDFDCYFNDTDGTLTVTIKDNNGTELENYELKRAVPFPVGQGYPLAKVDTFKGFNEFEQGDSDINDDIWTLIHSGVDTVYLMLYVYSYGYSLDPNHMWAKIESPLEYVGQLYVKCQEYSP